MNSLEKKTMHNEKAKRIRNAHRAFVEKTMEGATRILKRGYYMRPRRTQPVTNL